MSTPDRRGMLDRADKAPSIRWQCMLLGKHEGIYRKGYADGCEAKAGESQTGSPSTPGRRLHQALGYRAPMAVGRERHGQGARRLWT